MLHLTRLEVALATSPHQSSCARDSRCAGRTQLEAVSTTSADAEAASAEQAGGHERFEQGVRHEAIPLKMGSEPKRGSGPRRTRTLANCGLRDLDNYPVNGTAGNVVTIPEFVEAARRLQPLAAQHQARSGPGMARTRSGCSASPG